MSNTDDFKRLEDKIDEHIKQHDIDFKKIILWLLATLIGLIISIAGSFITYGQTIEKVNRLEKESENKVDDTELQLSVDLINEKFDNIDEKLDDIKEGLNLE